MERYEAPSDESILAAVRSVARSGHDPRLSDEDVDCTWWNFACRVMDALDGDPNP